ncbi:MAG: TonB-dependent receptor [Candidatus Symbiothrix sp.]|jgi:TonB-linked SusC/RagA family outer membrane protein|nr:TonB-dependent receptor [Candidatus Symbiothrix sp.]
MQQLQQSFFGQVWHRLKRNRRWAILLFSLCLFTAVDVSATVSQQPGYKVSGTVTEANGEPVIGASVKEKGTTNGSVTDVDGKFTFNVSSEATTLEVSYLGYRTETIQVIAGQPVKVTLTEDTEQLDEVVVVGYGTVKKRDLTGSVGSVSAKKIIESPVVSAAEAIQGKVAGVLVSNSSWTPGATPSILIRGTRSINASNDPLYVVDGIPISMAPNLFSPGDIESIEVLKDASATAIYGSRGANGVILITTKRGKSGKAQVTYNGYYGATTIQNKLELMNGAEYAEYVRESYRGAGQYASDVPNMELDKTLSSFIGDDYTWQSIAMAYDANGNYDPSKVRSGALWWEEVERTGMVTDHQLNVSGGNDKSQYAFGATYYRAEGIYKNQDYQRYSVKLSIDTEATSWLKIGGQSHYSNSLQHRGTAFQDSWRVNPLGRLYDDEGNLTECTSGVDTQWWNPLQYLAPGAVVNPYKVHRFLGSYYGEVKLPLDGLRFRTNVGIDFHSRQDYSFASALARTNTLNRAQNSTAQTFAYTNENLLYYDKQIGKHSFGATLLQSVQRNRAESLSATVQNLPSDELLFNDIASALEITAYDSNNQVWSLASFMGRLNYNFNSRYYATVSMRYDGSSRLAEGHKWVSFPAFALAWRINEESFLRNFQQLNNLKLRLGYGVTANAAISPYQTKGLLAKKYYNYGTSYVIGYAPSSLPDKSLTWETTAQWNIGLDFGFFGGRLNGSVEGYMQNTSDLLLNRQLPAASGYSSVLTNVGKTKNKGLEISLSSVNVKTKDFAWSTDIMYSTNKEEIVELYNGKVDDIGNSWFIGEAINVFYDYKKTGIWQDTPEDQAEMAKYNANGHRFAPGTIKLLDVNGDYKITADDDRLLLGHKNPSHIFSLSNTLNYKDFDLNLIVYGTAGGMLLNGTRIDHQSYRNNSVKLDYWTASNPTNAYPQPNRLQDNIDYESALYYEKSDFLRIKTITLGYSLPNKLLSKAYISNCRFYVTAQNPFVFTNFTGVDPEGATTALGSGTARSYASPSISTWLLGVNLNF